jgi:hypothetical protein
MKRLIALGLTAALVAGPAAACEDMQSDKTVLSNADFPVRGHSYWTDKSPVSIKWGTGLLAATATPDDNGEWTVMIKAPAEPGSYKLVATQNRDDSAPVTITVNVVQKTADAGMTARHN